MDTLGLVDLQSTLLAFVEFVHVLAVKIILVLTVHAMNGVVFFTLFVGSFLLENFCWKREGREERTRDRWRGVEKEGVEGVGRE